MSRHKALMGANDRNIFHLANADGDVRCGASLSGKPITISTTFTDRQLTMSVWACRACMRDAGIQEYPEGYARA